MDLDNVLEKLTESGFTLGGSRYYRAIAVERLKEPFYRLFTGSGANDKQFIKLTGESDWDFYFNINATDAGRKLDTILDMGFVRSEDFYEYGIEDGYGNLTTDMCFHSLYKHPDLPIDVSAKVEYSHYRDVFENFGLNYFIEYLWKSNPNRLITDMNKHKMFVKDTIDMLVSNKITQFKRDMDRVF